MASSLTQFIQARGRAKITLRELRAFWLDARPDQVNAPDRDARLLDEIRGLNQAGLLRLPAEASYERVGNPRMPLFVTVVRTGGVTTFRDWSQVPWHPNMGFWTTLNERERVVAEKINAWMLAADPSVPFVPLRERSLEILGDEKAMDGRVRNHALFAGRLPISAIKAILVPHPLPYRRTEARGAPILVVENHHTYWSFAEWNERERAYAAVIYGSGQAFCSSSDALSLAMAECGAIGAEYFGDLDPAGVAIPLRFIQSTGIRLDPALRFYQSALDSGRRREGVNRLPHDAELLLHWLPSLAELVRAVWDAGFRVPQEAVGTEYLSKTPKAE